MKKLVTLSASFLLLTFSFAQHLVSKTLLGSYTKTQIDSILTANGIPTFIFHGTYDVDAYKITYSTMDYDSTTITATGLFAVPKNMNCPIPLVSYGHGTTSVKEDVPSRLNGEGIVGLVSASNGVAMCEPDYTGMGDGVWPHYYLHAFTQAMCNIDLIRAVREVCQQDSILLSSHLFLSGYSQGGFVTMATHKYMQTYFSNEFNVTKSFPGAGSYDMSGAMVDLMLSDSSYPSPGYLPFLICTWNHIYHFYTNASDYLKSPYDTLLPPLVDGINSIDDLNNYMPDTPKLIFHQAVIDTFASNPNHPFRKALQENDVYQWVPQSPMTLLHCLHDRQVPIQNTRNAYNYFIQHGATGIDTIDPNPSLGHGDCGEVYFIFLKSFLDSFNAAHPCVSSVENFTEESELEIFPSPVHGEFTVQTKNSGSDFPVSIRVFDALGKEIFSAKSPSSILNVSCQNWSPGIYFLFGKTERRMYVKKFLKE